MRGSVTVTVTDTDTVTDTATDTVTATVTDTDTDTDTGTETVTDTDTVTDTVTGTVTDTVTGTVTGTVIVRADCPCGAILEGLLGAMEGASIVETCSEAPASACALRRASAGRSPTGATTSELTEHGGLPSESVAGRLHRVCSGFFLRASRGLPHTAFSRGVIGW